MIQGWEIRVRGQVQGVGFRPFVWALAQQMGLRGEVLNDPYGVVLRVTGAGAQDLPDRLRADAPPLARIDGIEITQAQFDTLPPGFEIAPSEGSGAETRITPDAATCPACLAELWDPADRRHRYAFANCTNCGPRFTIITGLPYDRAKTTMAPFHLCAACAAEYADPRDRRFHAQPVACACCGPRLWLDGSDSADPIEAAAALLRAGKILAVKGLGGVHLACDALNPEAVALLRQRKRRPAKPFALMGTLQMIRAHGPVSAAEAKLLQDPAAPIVLIPAQPPKGIAPGHRTLGWMLPYTPLHHLLLAATGGPLVMTSGNLSGEPQVIGNDEALDKLAPFADGFLLHDRQIARRLDDSVERADPPMVLRRARGRVPGVLPLPPGFQAAPQIVAYGGQMKGALCLLKNGQALLGHHLGDLDDALSYDAFLQADRDYRALFDHAPTLAACDLHPDFAATRHAHSTGLPVIQVQHHHAHMAACMAENLWPLEGGKVAGIVLDGLGLGPDGTIWGGELLLGDYTSFERRAWLAPAPLIGGDKAQTEPWRNALVRLDGAGLSAWAETLFPQAPVALARQVAAAGTHAPLSSSAGRLFDAVAACLGLCPMAQSYEGEAAMRLEACAEPTTQPGFALTRQGPVIDPAPLFHAIHSALDAQTPLSQISARVHAGLGRAFAEAAAELVDSGAAQAVALSGGCFQNALLLRETLSALTRLGDPPVLLHRQTPANDGGLALGQAIVAAARTLQKA